MVVILTSTCIYTISTLSRSVLWGHRGCDHMVVGFITTNAIGAYHN